MSKVLLTSTATCACVDISQASSSAFILVFVVNKIFAKLDTIISSYGENYYCYRYFWNLVPLYKQKKTNNTSRDVTISGTYWWQLLCVSWAMLLTDCYSPPTNIYQQQQQLHIDLRLDSEMHVELAAVSAWNVAMHLSVKMLTVTTIL